MRIEARSVLAAFAVSLCLAWMLASCGAAPRSSQSPEVIKIACVTLGPVSNAGWDAAAYRGLMKAKEALNRSAPTVEVAFQENVPEADVERVMRSFAAQGYRLIIGHDYGYGDHIFRVARDYPKVAFMWAGGDTTAPNVGVYMLKNYEAFYLAGILAARMSSTNRIGTIGGFEIFTVVEAHEAFKAGARSVKPDITVEEIFVGSWHDAAKGKEAALAMIDLGVDVIRHEGEGYGLGVLEAAKERGIHTISSMTDQNELAPAVVLTSVVWDIAPYIEAAVAEVRRGTFEGSVRDWGMKEGLVYLAPYHQFSRVIPQSVQDEVDRVRTKILKGELVVPRISRRPS
jgi:basic membrane protein A and related proteins